MTSTEIFVTFVNITSAMTLESIFIVFPKIAGNGTQVVTEALRFPMKIIEPSQRELIRLRSIPSPTPLHADFTNQFAWFIS